MKKLFILFSILTTLTSAAFGQDKAQELLSQFPSFPGGNSEYNKFFQKNIKWPDTDIPPNKTNDRVILQFMVDTEGNISDITVVQSLGKEYDQEAVRLVKKMPRWIPAKEDGEAVAKQASIVMPFIKISYSRVSQAKNFYKEGNSFYAAGKFEKAIKAYSRALKIRPSAADVYYNRAAAYLQIEKAQEACEDLSKIIAIDEEAERLHLQVCNQ